MTHVIYKDTIQSITLTAGTADSQYPLTNLRDGHPRKPFRTTGGNTCTLVIQESGNANAMGIVLSNCDTITATSVLSMVYLWGVDATESVLASGESADGTAVVWVDDTDSENFTGTSENYDGQSGNLFLFLSGIGIPRTITLQCAATNYNYVSIGLITAGPALYLRGLSYDTQGSSEDKSAEVELNDGSTWYKPLRILRTLSTKIIMYAIKNDADPEGYHHYDDFISSVWLTQGKTPMYWHFAGNGIESDLYAGLSVEPVSVMFAREYKKVSINLKERI